MYANTLRTHVLYEYFLYTKKRTYRRAQYVVHVSVCMSCACVCVCVCVYCRVKGSYYYSFEGSKTYVHV